MRSSFAGPWFWRLLHGLAHVYDPAKDRQRMAFMLSSTQTLFPCRNCRNHYREKLAKGNFCDALDSRRGIVTWVIHLHNQVNVDTGKRAVSVAEGSAFGAKQSRFICRNIRVVSNMIAQNLRERYDYEKRGIANRISEFQKLLSLFIDKEPNSVMSKVVSRALPKAIVDECLKPLQKLPGQSRKGRMDNADTCPHLRWIDKVIRVLRGQSPNVAAMVARHVEGYATINKVSHYKNKRKNEPQRRHMHSLVKVDCARPRR